MPGTPSAPLTIRRLLILGFCCALFLVFLAQAGAQVHVRGYFRRDGTYVRPHMRTSPDGNPYNNYSFPGNFNPNTGKVTTGDPAKYLERYYSKQRTESGATSTFQSQHGPQWSPGPVLDLPSLPGDLAKEELSRSAQYCSWITPEAAATKQCLLSQQRALSSIALPDYTKLPKSELERSARYCEWLFGDNRAGFYNCLNSQMWGLRRASGATFDSVPQTETARALAYCEWLYGDNRAGYQACIDSQSRTLSEPRSEGEWRRAQRYCEWLYGDNRAGAMRCRDSQARGIRSQYGIDSTGLPSGEWRRAASYCEWLYGDNRSGALSCLASQARGLRRSQSTIDRAVPLDVSRYCEWLYGDNRSEYWSCISSRTR
jgi:hypothetical protein